MALGKTVLSLPETLMTLGKTILRSRGGKSVEVAGGGVRPLWKKFRAALLMP
ncbi:MAG: hypothetical protein HC890_09460 [Chloroflexaceae bacterium]|nr:hypothetical protein [Chloroflexaceae bacterium]